MGFSLQQLSDRLEIQDLITDYADIIDQKNFDDLQHIFTEDAFIDYSVFGGAKGTRTEIIQFLHQVMGAFPNTQHMTANLQVKLLSETTATGKVMCFNPQELDLGDNKSTYMLGLWYVDEYRKTEQGWRISKRVEERSWTFNVPEFMNL